MPGPVSLPPRFKRVITGEEGRSCVRTDVIFVPPEKPKKDPACSRETSVSKESSSKAEVRINLESRRFLLNTGIWFLKAKVNYETSDQSRKKKKMYAVNQRELEATT